MDNKITKKRISEHLEYDWIKYLGIILASVFIWVAVYTLINNDKDYEILEFFAVAPRVGAERFEREVRGDLYAAGDKVIRRVSVDAHAEGTQGINELLMTTASFSSDILLLPESRMSLMQDVFLPMPDGLLREFLPADKAAGDYEYYYFGAESPDAGKIGAVRVDLLDINKTEFDLGTVITDDDGAERREKYYVAFNVGGKNLGAYGAKSGAGNAQTIIMMRTFFRLYALKTG